MEEFSSTWWDEELVRELFNDESPIFVSTEITEPEEISISRFSEPVTSHNISKVLPVPMTEDFENALWKTGENTIKEFNEKSDLKSGISILEKGLSKIDHKYTLKIKSCGNGMADDGYKWRKYGQKSIKNSPYPRCTNSKCSAKKQVEQSGEDRDTFIITYEGLHLHFTYSHFFIEQPPPQPQPQPDQINPPTKKPKMNEIPLKKNKEAKIQESAPLVAFNPPSPAIVDLHHYSYEGIGSQGLLEDMVPLMIRNPSHQANTLSSSSSSSSCYSSSPPTSSSPLSWWS
ncbi:hypothetical protein GIB67_040535 [Kingdonia uniflora]|uniref:WRKY domain-containing protein n=1 Tax=Kingdonia uniflora TaxID=39325 RepID=A0A7J7L5E1_9MAGN|nr:hypothetical protein GIB67_040535 [Kingdonia uniflora]